MNFLLENVSAAHGTLYSNFLDEAFAASMLKKNEEALEKLQQAVDNKETFDIGK